MILQALFWIRSMALVCSSVRLECHMGAAYSARGLTNPEKIVTSLALYHLHDLSSILLGLITEIGSQEVYELAVTLVVILRYDKSRFTLQNELYIPYQFSNCAFQICDMINGNESDVDNVDFELYRLCQKKIDNGIFIPWKKLKYNLWSSLYSF